MKKTYIGYSTRKTSQAEGIPGKNMVENSAGGFAFAIDDWARLDRFLILGTEGGTYYASERKITIENAECVRRCIAADGIKTVDRIVEISDTGRAPKNDPALFALAMCAGLGDEKTRKHALDNLPKVARIGTHLFHFVTYVEQFRGWGRSLSNAVKNWYQEKSVDDLAYQVVKYQSRDGWSHRDLLRLAHPKTDDPQRNWVYKYITDSLSAVEKGDIDQPSLIVGFEAVKRVDSAKKAAYLIKEYGLTREMIPTEWLNDPGVWEALLEKMPMTAMIRNLAKMTNISLLKPMSNAARKIISELNNLERLKKARIHPIAILSALKIYQQGHGERGSLTWEPVIQIVDALDNAFYLSFDAVDPTNKRWLLALDVSGSMSMGTIAGVPGLTPCIASAAMSLVTAKTEKNWHIMGFSHEFKSLPISPRQRIEDAMRVARDNNFGNTDCALPMLWALKNNVEIDVFTIYTDNETWAGHIHPCQALEKYRQVVGIPAKLIVVGMTATNFSIADPNDAGMMDVVGFDTAAPQVMSDFVAH
ncbi:MAG: TROVE domain-containing protein [Candidatus Brocadia sp. WS118]|nr:MAG: TROVE domain-containing protein [Candidatus Brocadia sp. WS118]